MKAKGFLTAGHGPPGNIKVAVVVKSLEVLDKGRLA